MEQAYLYALGYGFGALLFFLLVSIVLLINQSKALKRLAAELDNQPTAIQRIAETVKAEQTENIQSLLEEHHGLLRDVVQNQHHRHTFFGHKKEEHHAEIYKLLTEIEWMLKAKRPELEPIQKKWSHANRFYQMSELFLTDDMQEVMEQALKSYSQFIYQLDKEGNYYFPDEELVDLMDLQTLRYQMKQQIIKESQPI
jgi:uncharacterized membrane protein YccC